MKTSYLVPVLFLLFIFTGSVSAQEEKKTEPKIREYWFVLLTKGSNRNQDSATAAGIQKGHMDNMERLYMEGKLKVAGPFGKNDNGWQGIFIFDCPSQQEVEALLKTDPAIASGRLNYTISSWWTEPSGNFKPGKPQKAN